VKDQPFIFPEALMVGSLEEAEPWVHGGCPSCEHLIRIARKHPTWQVVWNTKTQDVVALIP
jgi:hypothetical protein